MGKVLVGIDFTNEGQAAAREGIAEASRRGSEVVFLHYVRLGADEQVHARREQAEHLVQRAESAAQQDGVAHSSIVEVGVSSAATRILDVAEKGDIDVIVVGTRRRSRVGKALMGGDAQQVILSATCPVLCVKAPVGADEIRAEWED